ncbi:50S ribosomal protein L27 [Patescibacteria group bacterium]|nr:50S ribosomal protein L27 [Patescibacteria group bacterium]
MAHRKAQGSAKNLRDSGPKYLGVKLYSGQPAKAGSILVRQRGTSIMAGENVRVGHDHTLYAIKTGIVKFTKKNKKGFDGQIKKRKVVNVLPA